MDTIERSPSGITFTDPFPLLQRVILFCFGLVPLAAPYELLIRPYWNDGSLQFATMPLLISLGSIAFGILFMVSALFGAEKHITFDSGLRMIIHRSRPGLAGLREQRYPFGTVERVEIRTHEWSDGPASHNIVLTIARGPEIEFGRFGTKEEADLHLREISGLLGRSDAVFPH